MGTFDLLMNGFAHALTPQNLLFAAFGVLLGTAIGVLPGILALALHSIGMLGKLFADAIEQVDEGPRDAPVILLVMGLGGFVIAQVGSAFIERFGLRSGLVGSLITAVVTSLPEFVTTIVAVRRGALQLAVGGIIGGNTFDTLFLVISDLSLREGSLYHAVGTTDLYWLGTGLLMTGILLAGLIARQREGPARIGFESVAMLAVYAIAATVEVMG